MKILFTQDEFNVLKKGLFVYASALKIMNAKLDILREDFNMSKDNCPIEHIKSRLKSPESIAEKLHKKNLTVTAENALKYLDDIAGVRVICSFSKDIYEFVNILKSHHDLKLFRESNYIEKPKPSGYRSYHLIFEIPVFLSDSVENVRVEVQLRTAAMDFWASLEHKVKYKYDGKVPDSISSELRTCADSINELDERMLAIHEALYSLNRENISNQI